MILSRQLYQILWVSKAEASTDTEIPIGKYEPRRDFTNLDIVDKSSNFKGGKLHKPIPEICIIEVN